MRGKRFPETAGLGDHPYWGPWLAAQGHSQKSSAGPTIEFTKIPPAVQGGRERTDTIAGRVRNAHPGQQIVITRTVGRGGCSPGLIARLLPSEQTLPGARKLTWDLSMLCCWSILSTILCQPWM